MKTAMMLAALVAVSVMTAPGEAAAESRTLKIHFTHTGERAAVTYKRNGRYLKDGLRQLNHLVRDFRRNEATEMDPRLFDLVWEVYQASGSQGYINVVSGYRSPATNSMLHEASSGVATRSLHMQGMAIDIRLPGRRLADVRDTALGMSRGGVGYYASSDFVHVDVGRVRRW